MLVTIQQIQSQAITQAMSAAQWHELMSLLVKVACNPLHLQGTDLCRTYLMPAG